MLEDGAFLNLCSDHYRHPPQGLAGGGPGGLGFLGVIRDGEVIPLPATATVALRRGDLVELGVGGGAGWGDPARCPAGDIARDLRDGRVAPDDAACHHPGATAALPGSG